MLARRLKIVLDGVEVGVTPMLVPAVSSRLNIELSKLLETLEEIVNGPLLVSAYDLHHSSKPLQMNFPDLIFIDSGGYECSKLEDISEIGMFDPESKEWNENLHDETITNWNSQIPRVLISYDHPKIRESTNKQIERASALFNEKPRALKEFLIKPETRNSTKINIREIQNNIAPISDFDIIGFAEKELGSSVLDRMVSIAKIRALFDANDLEIPIQVFGSLDPINTPLYYMSGADIFDGLSWLRFYFERGNAMYREGFGPKTLGVQADYHNVWISTIANNFNYLQRMKLDMERFSSTEDFNLFDGNSRYFKEAYSILSAKMEAK